MRSSALKTSPRSHWAAPRLIEPAEGTFFTRTAAPELADRAVPADHRRAIVRLLRAGLGINVVLWTGLAIQAARII